MLKELIAPEAVERVLLFIAFAGPLFGLIIGTMIGAHERCAWPRMLAGVLIGSLGSAVYGMWRVYGAITSALGLDSVASLVLLLFLFAVLGCALGVAILVFRDLVLRVES